MPEREPETNPVERAAQDTREKFGEFAEVYAETPSEAAEIAGEKADEDHWKKVAQNVERGEASQP